MNTMWKALLYAESEIAQEQYLKKWMSEKAPQCGIVCQKVEEPVTKQTIQQAITKSGVSAEECLMVLAKQLTWELTQEQNIASLPYINPTLGRQFFRGAWIVVEGFEEVDDDFLRKVYQRHHKIPWTVIVTKRCFLRELSLEDLDDLYLLYSDKEATKYVEPLYERKEEVDYQRAYIANMYEYYGYGMWLVCNKDSGEIIGRAGLEHRECNGETVLEMGYFISANYQKKGYATEITKALIDYAKKELAFSHINCFIQKENVVSIHLATKLGFLFCEEVDNGKNKLQRYVLDLAKI